VRNTITRVKNNTSGTTRGIQRENSLNLDKECRAVEGFKHDLGHLLTIRFWILGSFSQEDGMFFRGNAKLIVKGMMPRLNKGTRSSPYHPS
jgi:hypothetical protein